MALNERVPIIVLNLPPRWSLFFGSEYGTTPQCGRPIEGHKEDCGVLWINCTGDGQ